MKAMDVPGFSTVLVSSHLANFELATLKAPISFKAKIISFSECF